MRDWKERYGTGAAASQPQARSAGLANAGGSSAVAAAVEIAALRRELDSIRAQNDILKSLGHSSPARSQRYALIQILHHEQPRMNLAQACQTSASAAAASTPTCASTYAHAAARTRSSPPRSAPHSPPAGEPYGSPRLMHALRHKGLRHGNNRIARLMREQNLRVRQKRRFVPRTTVTDKTAAVAPNHLLQHSAPKRLNEVWVTDITYLPTREGWLYLAAEMDLCSRRILGWSTREDLATTLPNAALELALQTRGSKPQDLLHHSDRGCQYTSSEFRQRLRLRGITASMSRTANCYDNATMESFWATLKAECFGTTVPATRA
ncbi:MAG: IS3 family transposase [Verrucomicrobiaceae bacterium]